MAEFSEPVINAKVFANEFRRLIDDYSPPNEGSCRFDPGKHCRDREIVDYLVLCKNSVIRGVCDEATLKKSIIDINHSQLFHPRIWWYIITCGLLHREDMFSIFENCHNSRIAANLSLCLVTYVFRETLHSGLIRNMVCDLVNLILDHKVKCESDGRKSLLYSSLLQEISTHLGERNVKELINVGVFVSVLKSSLSDEFVIKAVASDFIKVMLIKGQMTPVEEVLLKHEAFMKREKFGCDKQFEILNLLEVDEMVTLLKWIFTESSEPVHWERLFYILSSIASHYKDVLKEIRLLNQFLLEEALNHSSETMLMYALIIAKQFSFPHVPSLPSYLQWFSTTVSNDSFKLFNTWEKSDLFMNFLIKAVKYDLPYYLKVHINRAPTLPLECQPLLADYMQLAKARLAELNESSFELGLFDNVTRKSSDEFDVETVIRLFAKTNEVPKCLFEASLLYKQYYEKKFLVKLLSTFEGRNSVRHNLITKLYDLGKIPNPLYLHYKQIMI